MNEPIFQVDHLSLAYPGPRGHPAAPILDDVSFTVERGCAFTLVGPSGVGEVEPPQMSQPSRRADVGAVRFDGHDVRSFDPRELRRQVALVMQTPVLFVP